MVVAIFFSLVQLDEYHVLILDFFRKDYAFNEGEILFMFLSKIELTFF